MNDQVTTALVVLQPEQSAALIGQAVAMLPQVIQRRQQGCMVIVGGSTTRHVVRYLLGEDPGRDSFAIGCIQHGRLGETDAGQRGPGAYLIQEGVVTRGWPGPLLSQFNKGDLYIKGANAVDAMGHSAILMGSPTGGTIGAAWSILMARGGELIVPVSLRKQIPSVMAVAGKLGHGRVDRVMGSPVGYMPIPAGFATVVTEIDAFRSLYQITATLVASGGWDDCAGALVFHLSGSATQVERAWEGIGS
ncbi:MAG: hypothetical protein HQL58_02385 [Magnetococcales bacterium]|nr:hypothetical protein [Magnetococcales bacterium]